MPTFFCLRSVVTGICRNGTVERLERSTKPLLQSRNASVVMATAQLYWHMAPRAEVTIVAKSLVRLLRSHNEVQAIVLNSIASMTIKSQPFGPKSQPSVPIMSQALLIATTLLYYKTWFQLLIVNF